MATRAAFDSTDADVVESRLRATYGTVHLEASSIRVRDDLVRTDGLVLGRLECDGLCRVETETPVLTVLATTGTYRWAVGDERGNASAAPLLVRPGRPTSALLADTVIDGITFQPAALQRTARAAYADDRVAVRFDSASPRSPELGRRFRRALGAAVDARALVAESELLASTLHRWLAIALLECFALRGDPEARSRTIRSQRDGYGRARAFIDDYASLPISTTDIAEAAGLSIAQLDAAFRTFAPNGRSAQDHLRLARLDAAHGDLVRGDPSSGDTVREIALRWGFTPNALAKHHRQVYGVDARWVLDR